MYRQVENFIAGFLYYSGLVKLALWWRRRLGKNLVILNYHRASGGDLRQHLLYLRRHYRLLHLEMGLKELYMPPQGGVQRDQRTPLVLTFDDGNRDNYTDGFKLACELQVPITMFLIPGYIESGSRFWWDEATHLVSNAHVKETTIAGRKYHLERLDEQGALIQTIDARVRNATSVAEREEFLTSVRKALAVPELIGTEERQATVPVTWAEVQAMEVSGLISFGAHSMHHPILAYLSDPLEVEYEVCECRNVLERQLGHAVYTFAYPCGKVKDIGENALRAVQQAGYCWALTTINGLNTPQTNPLLLRRVIVDVDQHWLSVAAKASGVWAFFTSLYRQPVTLMQTFSQVRCRGNR